MKRSLTLLLLAAGWVVAQDDQPVPPVVNAPAAAAAPAADKAIPEAYSEEHYAPTWSKNPFLIKSVAPTGPVVSFADDWELKGIKDVAGAPVALISNRKTQEFRRVTKTEDKDGFVLVDVNANRDRKVASAKIKKGAEEAEIKYGETAAPPPMMGAKPGGVGGQIPQPNGGQPPRPGNPVNNIRAGMPPQGTAGVGNTMPRPGNPMMQGNNGVAPVTGAPPSPSTRRRVLIPTPVPAAPPAP